MQENNTYKAGYVALVGEPNVGKSTLLNTVLQQKISIVTNKPQTTRHKILGILSSENYQIIFLDTPGIITPHYHLHQIMMQSVATALDHADIVLLLVDAEKIKNEGYHTNQTVLSQIRQLQKHIFLVINKIDTVEKTEILLMINTLHTIFPFEEIFPISALKNFGIQELIQTLTKYLPIHPPLYPPDIISEAPEKFFVSEIIREKIFERFSKEIPYSTTVDIVEFKEQQKRKHFIAAEIYLERQSQKKILIGTQGKALKTIGEQSRKEIEKFLGHPVFLELHVKVREHWREQEQWLKRLGY